MLLAFTSCKPKSRLLIGQHLGLLQPQLHLGQAHLRLELNPAHSHGVWTPFPRCSQSKPRSCQRSQGRASTALTLRSEGNVHNRETQQNVQQNTAIPNPIESLQNKSGTNVQLLQDQTSPWKGSHVKPHTDCQFCPQGTHINFDKLSWGWYLFL